MKLSDYMANFLADYGIEYAYIFTGGAIAHLIDSCWHEHEKSGMLKPFCVLHEQAGSMAIDAYSRITKKPGLVMATSGPGATNLLTGIGCSFYDSIPGLYITGQVRTWETKGDSKQRQLGFQETDIVSMAKPITKYAVLIEDPRDIRYEMEKALWMATNGRPGPVLIDLPMNIQWEEVDVDNLRPFIPPAIKEPSKVEFDKVRQLAEWMRSSTKVTLLAGGGIRNADAVEELNELAALCQIPVCVSFGGKDSFAHDNPLNVGLIGTMGNKAANETLNNSELVLAIGARLSWRQIRSKPDDFCSNSKIVHVDIDREELNQRVGSHLSFDWDAKLFLRTLVKELKAQVLPNYFDWAKARREAYDAIPFCLSEYTKQITPVHPYVFMKSLSHCMNEDDVILIDAGQNVMWGMQALEQRGSQRILTAWGHSPMGYSVAAGMGVSAHFENQKDKSSKCSPRTICTIGDGGFQVNIQELQTIQYYKLPLKIFIMNNHCYGAIKDYQDGNLDGRHYASSPEFGYEAPDLLAISSAYGIKTVKIDSSENLEDQIIEVLDYPGAIVCDVELGSDTFVTLDP